jgi:ribosomal protein S18 acetylase RimI-like enzyme
MAERLSIRRYRAKDHEQVVALHRLALEQVGLFIRSGPWDSDLDDIKGVYLKSGEFLVGEYERHIVAMGAFRRTSPERAELKRMRVHPDFQRRGYGQAILDALEKRAREMGYATLHLDTAVKQVAAQELYLKNGYQETGRTVLGGFDAILYEKRLR